MKFHEHSFNEHKVNDHVHKTAGQSRYAMHTNLTPDEAILCKTYKMLETGRWGPVTGWQQENLQ